MLTKDEARRIAINIARLPTSSRRLRDPAPLARVAPLAESAIMRSVFAHLRTRGVPNMIAFHPRNEGRDHRTLAGMNSGLGVVSGMPDVFIVKGGATYAIELKTENGRLADAQAEVLCGA
jgi:hypothetical protein